MARKNDIISTLYIRLEKENAKMGFFSKQLLDVIEWIDNSNDTILYQFPIEDNEIQNGGQLIVRESQVALFSENGVIADVFLPGKYKLTTDNLPLLSNLKAWPYGFNSPFKAEVYFINTKQFINQKWGTPTPILLTTNEIGLIQLRGYGIFAFQVTDPKLFFQQVTGTNQIYRTGKLQEYVQSFVTSALSEAIAEHVVNLGELLRVYSEVAATAIIVINKNLLASGFQITTLNVQSLSFPKEVEEQLNTSIGLHMMGENNARIYTQMKSADAMEKYAENPSIGGGLNGLGMGNAMGASFLNMNSILNESKEAVNQKGSAGIRPGKPLEKETTPEKEKEKETITTTKTKKYCADCGTEIPLGAKFCPGCGVPQQPTCGNCGATITAEMNFCSGCGNKIDK